MFRPRTASTHSENAVSTKMAHPSAFAVTVEANGARFEITTNDDEAVDDIFRAVARQLKATDYRFSDRFTLLHNGAQLEASTPVRNSGLQLGSRLVLVPKITTGLRGEPTTSQEIKKAISSMVESALDSGQLEDGPVTLVASVGNKQIAIRIGSKDAAETEVEPEAVTPISDEEADRLARQFIAEHAEEAKAAAAKLKETQADNNVSTRSCSGYKISHQYSYSKST